MKMIEIFVYTSYILFTILALTLFYVTVGMICEGADAMNTRSLECQNVVVENTSAIDSGGESYFIIVNDTPRMILDTAKISVIKKWAKINPGDTIYMKLGKQTVEFC